MIMGGWVVHGLMFYVIDDHGRMGGARNNLGSLATVVLDR